ncbi:MAG TPA: hypothetical protein VFW11_21275 [Cyclobacteriaceae bacterium]|nr:hypothetical protein [Cyclobacteriaceae bacterium]
MKKQTIIFLTLIFLCSLNAKAQTKVRADAKSSELSKTDPNQSNLQVVQPTQSAQQVQTAQYASTAVKTKYYSIDPTAFSSSWGVFEIRKSESGGAYLYSNTTGAGSWPYLVAPVNLPHGATITGMNVIFYDASASQDLLAILWQGGPNFGGPDSYNLGQIVSGYSGGSILQAKALTATVDNENHSYYVAVSPSNNAPWPENGDLKIKRVTIAYVEAE